MVPKFYGLPKIHKKDHPLTPIVSRIGSISHSIARSLADILSPLVRDTPHHLNNSADFAGKIQDHTRPETSVLRCARLLHQYTGTRGRQMRILFSLLPTVLLLPPPLVIAHYHTTGNHQICALSRIYASYQDKIIH